MTTQTTNWSPEGAVRTAVRRMTKRGVSLDFIYDTLLSLAPTEQHTKATGNIRGAIQRCVKHGVSPNNIHTAMLKVAEAMTITAIPAPAHKVTKPKKARTNEQIQADKDRMARVRACRKDSHITVAKSQAYPTTEGYEVSEVLPTPEEKYPEHPRVIAHPGLGGIIERLDTPTVPTRVKLTGNLPEPVVCSSFKELDALLNGLI